MLYEKSENDQWTRGYNRPDDSYKARARRIRLVKKPTQTFCRGGAVTANALQRPGPDTR